VSWPRIRARARLALLALTALLASDPMAAQSAGDGENIECDAATGMSTYYERPVGIAPVRLTARVRVNQLRSNRLWAPVIKVELISDRGERDNRIGVRLLPDFATGDVGVLPVYPGNAGDMQLPATLVSTDDPLPITIAITDRLLRLNFGELSRKPNPMPGAKWRLGISCSSVRVAIDDIRIGPIE
jgi:hypothetical protein